MSADEFRAGVRRLCTGESRQLVPFFVECVDGLTLLMCAKQLSSTEHSLLAPYAPNDGVNDELEGWAKEDVVCQIYDLNGHDEESAKDLSDYLVRERTVLLFYRLFICGVIC